MNINPKHAAFLAISNEQSRHVCASYLAHLAQRHTHTTGWAKVYCSAR